jgi:hypothetical protein
MHIMPGPQPSLTSEQHRDRFDENRNFYFEVIDPIAETLGVETTKRISLPERLTAKLNVTPCVKLTDPVQSLLTL